MVAVTAPDTNEIANNTRPLDETADGSAADFARIAATSSVPLGCAARQPCGAVHPALWFIAMTFAIFASIGSGTGAGAGDAQTSEIKSIESVQSWNARENILSACVERMIEGR